MRKNSPPFPALTSDRLMTHRQAIGWGRKTILLAGLGVLLGVFLGGIMLFLVVLKPYLSEEMQIAGSISSFFAGVAVSSLYHYKYALKRFRNDIFYRVRMPHRLYADAYVSALIYKHDSFFDRLFKSWEGLTAEQKQNWQLLYDHYILPECPREILEPESLPSEVSAYFQKDKFVYPSLAIIISQALMLILIIIIILIPDILSKRKINLNAIAVFAFIGLLVIQMYNNIKKYFKIRRHGSGPVFRLSGSGIDVFFPGHRFLSWEEIDYSGIIRDGHKKQSPTVFYLRTCKGEELKFPLDELKADDELLMQVCREYPHRFHSDRSFPRPDNT